MKHVIAFVSSILLITSCVVSQKEPEKKILPKLSWNQPEWDEKVYLELDSALPFFTGAKDVKTWCPKIDALSIVEQKHAIGEFMVAIAKYESSLNPKAFYMEPAPLNYHSIGLYQLSYEDNRGYPDCKLDKSKKNLEDPVVNIHCSFVIMKKLLKDGSISAPSAPWKGLSRYWSVMRPKKKDGSARPSYAGIIKRVHELVPACK